MLSFRKQLQGQKARYSGFLASSTVQVDPPPRSVQDLTHWRQLAPTTVNRKPIATEKFLETELGTVLSNFNPLITWGLKPRSISVWIHVALSVTGPCSLFATLKIKWWNLFLPAYNCYLTILLFSMICSSSFIIQAIFWPLVFTKPFSLSAKSGVSWCLQDSDTF